MAQFQVRRNSTPCTAATAMWSASSAAFPGGLASHVHRRDVTGSPGDPESG